jgi:hypothetical protein
MKTTVMFLFLVFFISGCATPTYQFQSTPSEAEVEVMFKNGVKKTIGKTPLTVNVADLNPTKEAMTVSFKKTGVEGQSVFVPPTMFTKSVEIDVILPVDTKLAGAKKTDQLIGDIASQVADTQKLIQAKQFGVAEQKLNKLISEHPSVSVFYSLMGNVQYLDRKMDAALGFYKKAFDLDPSSAEIGRVIQKIESLKSGGSR